MMPTGGLSVRSQSSSGRSLRCQEMRGLVTGFCSNTSQATPASATRATNASRRWRAYHGPLMPCRAAEMLMRELGFSVGKPQQEGGGV